MSRYIVLDMKNREILGPYSEVHDAVESAQARVREILSVTAPKDWSRTEVLVCKETHAYTGHVQTYVKNESPAPHEVEK